MKQLFIVSYDYPYRFNAVMYDNNELAYLEDEQYRILETIYETEVWSEDHKKLIDQARTMNVDELVICEDGLIFVEYIKNKRGDK